MSVRIGLLSDPHASAAPLREALAIFDAHAVDSVWCPGDIAGYGDELEETVALLESHHVLAVAGNHDIWYLEDTATAPDNNAARFLSGLGAVREQCIEGVRLYMVHASPPRSDTEGIRLLDEKGVLIRDRQREWDTRLRDAPYDVLVVGHTHQLFAERLGNALVINPGSTCFNHSCVILSLPEMRVQVFGLSGSSPLKTWNWGLQRGRDGKPTGRG